MPAHGQITMGTDDRLPACPTAQDTRIPAAVQQKDDLFVLIQGRLHLFLQDFGNHEITGAKRIFHRHNRDRRHLLIHPLTQRNEMIDTLPCPCKAFQRRRRRSQQHLAVIVPAPEQCHIPAMVGRLIFLLVGRILFLVKNDEAQVGKGKKHRTARTDDN